MPGLHFHSSNRLECLVHELSQVLRAEPGAPLVSEPIVVQSKGMERWLTLQLAELDGIAANYRFPFPNGLVEELFDSLLGPNIDQVLFAPAVLRLRLVDIILSHLHLTDFSPLRHYLGGKPRDRQLLQLAGQISDLFDQYSIYRPDLLLNWEKGGEGGWQAILWRLAAKGNLLAHRAARRHQFQQMMAQKAWEKVFLPPRLSLFGMSSLPPFHLEVIQTLSVCCDVHFFLLNPCREFWGDIRGIRNPDLPEADLGNSLLAANGRLGRDFFGWLWGQSAVDEQESFVHPEPDSLLHVLQNDILDLRMRGGHSVDAVPPVILAATDDSVQINSCHSLQRELEVLQDSLLELFQRHPDLQPRDILVMAPDIDSYAPYIAGVFESSPDPVRRIPYSIADRRVLAESTVIAHFVGALTLLDSRFAVSDVLALLESAAIRDAWKIEEDDLPILQQWLDTVRVRWGIDGEHRSACCGVPFADNSWGQGLDRLLLGYAVGESSRELFLHLAPGPSLGNDEGILLGRFCDFWQCLLRWRSQFSQSYGLATWCQLLAGFLTELMRPSASSEAEFLKLRQILAALQEEAGWSNCQQQVDFDAIRALLQERLNRQSNSGSYLSGAVTFAALLPMRSIPFRVIALLGMDDAAFPRQDQRLSFDLLRRDFRPGDRSRRAEDRYLFLEALISARDYLFISYRGQSCRDNSHFPPSVLVSELLDALDQGFRYPDGPPSKVLVRKHPLQPFSPLYFQGDAKLFSYSAENFLASQVQGAPRQQLSPFVVGSLPDPDNEHRQLSQESLQRFFKNPADYFLRQRLNLLWRDDEDLAEDQESFSLQPLDRYLALQSLVEERLQGQSYERSMDRARAVGVLPPGTPGVVSFQDLWTGSSDLVEALERFIATEKPTPVDGVLNIGPFSLSVRLRTCFAAGQVLWRGVKIGSRDLLGAWLNHLVFNLLQPDHPMCETVLLGLEGSCRFLEVAEPLPILEHILNCYWQGLRAPLAYFPKTSFEYASRRLNGQDQSVALEKARAVWFGSDFSRGEGLEPAIQKCFQDCDPLDEDFCVLAESLWAPLLSHRDVLS